VDTELMSSLLGFFLGAFTVMFGPFSIYYVLRGARGLPFGIDMLGRVGVRIIVVMLAFIGTMLAFGIAMPSKTNASLRNATNVAFVYGALGGIAVMVLAFVFGYVRGRRVRKR